MTSTHQPLAEPVAVVVLQAASKVVRQLSGLNVASQLVGRHQDHLSGSKGGGCQGWRFKSRSLPVSRRVLEPDTLPPKMLTTGVAAAAFAAVWLNEWL